MSDVTTTQPSVPAAATAAPAPPPATQSNLLYREAYQLALPASKQIPLEELLPVNVDVPSSVVTATGALPAILALRAQVMEELPKFDISTFDLLETHALGAGQAHMQFLGASGPAEALIALNAEATTLRDTMYSDALALSRRGIINGDKLGEFKGATGYKNVAFDLMGLSSVLRDHWEAITNKTALQLTELDHADALGKQLTNAVGAREQAPAVLAEVAVQRQRNFTLFIRSYDAIRRAISYLRWNTDDVETIAPSLYAGRGGRGKKDPTVPPADSTTAPAEGTAAPATPTAPATQPPKSGVTPVATTATKTPAAAGVGLPTADPFVKVS